LVPLFEKKKQRMTFPVIPYPNGRKLETVSNYLRCHMYNMYENRNYYYNLIFRKKITAKKQIRISKLIRLHSRLK